MIEVVFSESAEGALKLAKGFGKGKYSGGCVGVILRHEDGREAAPEELEAARREFEERQRKEWEEAIPMEGSAGDVFGFHLALSFGDISRENFWAGRKRALERLWFSMPGMDEEIERLVGGCARKLEKLLARAESEAVRIWYSGNPDEICGMHWMMAQLNGICRDVHLVRLPEREVREDEIRTYSGWGDVAPGEWGRFLQYEQPAAPELRRWCMCRWRDMEEENAPLRGELGGKLCSLREDVYDWHIRREIEAMPGEFHQGRLIGNVLGKYALGISDGFVALRMEKMIGEGELIPVTDAQAGEPLYHRKLKKRS